MEPGKARVCVTQEVVIEVPHEPPAVKGARDVMRDWLWRWKPPVDHDVALLLANELVTNAILHGAAPAVLRVRCADGVLRIGVTDASTEKVPVIVNAGAGFEGGRGFRLVAQLADDYGVHISQDEKCVWCELRPHQ